MRKGEVSQLRLVGWVQGRRPGGPSVSWLGSGHPPCMLTVPGNMLPQPRLPLHLGVAPFSLEERWAWVEGLSSQGKESRDLGFGLCDGPSPNPDCSQTLLFSHLPLSCSLLPWTLLETPDRGGPGTRRLAVGEMDR